jgi:hypothetical protein
MPWLKEQWEIVAATILVAGLSAGAFTFVRSTDWL